MSLKMRADVGCRYVSVEEKRTQGVKRDNEVLLQRMKQASLTVPYRVIDNPLKLAPEDWYGCCCSCDILWLCRGWQLTWTWISCHSQTHVTCCITANVLQTNNVDAQCDKLANERQCFALKVASFQLPRLRLTYPTCIWCLRWGWPCLSFAEVFGIRKLESSHVNCYKDDHLCTCVQRLELRPVFGEFYTMHLCCGFVVYGSIRSIFILATMI